MELCRNIICTDGFANQTQFSKWQRPGEKDRFDLGTLQRKQFKTPGLSMDVGGWVRVSLRKNNWNIIPK